MAIFHCKFTWSLKTGFTAFSHNYEPKQSQQNAKVTKGKFYTGACLSSRDDPTMLAIGVGVVRIDLFVTHIPALYR